MPERTERAALITVLILERPMCLPCIAAKTDMTVVRVTAYLAEITRRGGRMMTLASAEGSARLGGLGSASVGSRFSGRAVDLLVDGLDLAERALDIVDHVADVFPALPGLGKDFFKRRPLGARIADHVGTLDNFRASPLCVSIGPLAYSFEVVDRCGSRRGDLARRQTSGAASAGPQRASRARSKAEGSRQPVHHHRSAATIARRAAALEANSPADP